MRIRKRKVPLPMSLLSPIPLEDLNLLTRSPVDHTATSSNNNNNSQPFDDQLTCSHLHRSININDEENIMTKSDLLVNNEEQVPQLVSCLGIESVQKSNDASNKSITGLGAASDSTCSNGPSLPPSNLQAKGQWCDVDKAMPMKKQKGSIDQTATISIDNHVEKIKNDNDDNNNGVNISNKKAGSKRGKTIMEGSRCSRVNGRGWRCCQPTLVGYSLCEHHLGKGRLRSMSTVRGRPASTTSKKTALGMSSSEDCSPLMQLCEAAKKESDMMRNNNKSFVGKRVINKKVGVVKARSLSSLLGQTDNTRSSRVPSEDLELEKESKGTVNTLDGFI